MKKILIIGIVSMFILTCAVPFTTAETNTKVNIKNIRQQISPLNNPSNEKWVKTFGGDSFDGANDVQITSDGGYIVVGYSMSYGVGGSDVWLIKLDGSGNKLWDKTYGTKDSEFGYSVQQTTDGGYIIAGDNNYGIWLIKTDFNGNIEWDKTFKNIRCGNCVRQTSDGGYIITGDMEGAAYNTETCLLKTDSQGNLEWNKTFGENSDGNCVQQTNDGGYIITGYADYNIWLLKTDSNGNKEWEKKFVSGNGGFDEGYSLMQTDDGGYIIAGTKTSESGLAIYVRLIKTDSEGNTLWDKTYGNGILLEEWGLCVQQTTDKGFIITGALQTTLSFNLLLIKTNQDGNLQWKKTYNNAGGLSVKQTLDGGYIIAGETEPIARRCDVLVIKTDSTGGIKSKALTQPLLFSILERLLDRFPMLARLLNLP